MSSVEQTLVDARDDRDGDQDGPLFWWCRSCGGPTNARREKCFFCGAARPDHAEELTREEIEQRARQREQVEEGLL